MLLLSAFLYFHLPQYIPKGSIEFVAGLHEVTTRQACALLCWVAALRGFDFFSIHSFRLFYSSSSSPLLLRGAPNTARILCRSFMPKRHTQLRVKDLPKVHTWWLERDSNPRPFRRKATNLPMSHHAPQAGAGAI